MSRELITVAAAAAQGAALILVAWVPLGAQAGPPVRVLDSAVAVTTEKIASVSEVIALKGGRVLLNDGTGRRLLLLDSAMQLLSVVADSVAGSDSSYGARAGRLLPYRGDSSVLIDPLSLSMLVLDGEGRIARISATPRAAHATFLTGAVYGSPGVDASGRLIYRISDPSASATVAVGGGIIVPTQPDSAPVLRLDLDSRKLDTAGKVKIQKRITEPYRTASGSISTRTLTTPMPALDDWAVMSDGSVAFLRHSDYHVDWLNRDGSWTSSPVMPFEWQRMTDEHKAAFVDSVRKALEHDRWKNIARYDSLNFYCFNLAPPERPGSTAPFLAPAQPAVAGTVAPATGTAGAAAAVTATGAGQASGSAGASGAAAPAVPPKRPGNCPTGAYIVDQMFGELNVIKPDALPDYKPPFSTNSTRADADGNLWIRVNQMRPVPNTWLFDVVNRQGVLFDRIRMPAARTLVGFAPGGIAYVAARSGTTVKLERVRWR